MAKKKSKKKNSKHTTPAQREKLASSLLAKLEKRGELNPGHVREFNHLLDDIAQSDAKKTK